MIHFSTRKASPLIQLIVIFTLVISACGGPATTPAPDVPTSSADSATAAPSPTATSGPEMRTVYRLGEGEVQEPMPPPATLDAVLDNGVEAGSWDYGQGLIFMLRFVSGELAPEDIPGFEAPSEFSPTGIVRQAQDYLNDPDSDPQYREEIRRLLGILVPDQDALDQLSQPAGNSFRSGITPITFRRQAGPPPECADIASLGFKAGVNPGDYCYLFQEATAEGSRLRVYYPKWWQDDPARMSWANAALQSLSKSASSYSQFGTYGDVNLVFSLTQLLGGQNTLAFETAFPANSPCPIVVLPLVYEHASDSFLQTVAHEAFHCYQDWNLTMSPYEYHRWWAEGSAEYFSNVVYPNVNYELRWMDAYYDRSILEPWFDLDYCNFMLFQFLANRLGNEGLLIMLKSVSSAGNVQAQAQVLANYGDLDDLFEEFVVATMSTGVRDTGGTNIRDHSYLLLPMSIQDKGDQQFVVNPFIAGRYIVHYRKERRFLQEPEEDDHVQHSAAARGEHRDISSWSKLPPEVRSQCNEDKDYLMAVTSVDGPGTVTDKVNTVDVAVCDPCLLGKWDVDPESFAAYMQRVAGSNAQTSQGPVEFGVSGHYYVEFKVDGDMTTRRADFQLRVAAGGNPAIITLIDSQGSAHYSTTDGESLSLWAVQNHTNSITSTLEGSGLSIRQAPAMTTVEYFGAAFGSGSGMTGAESGPQSGTAKYVCGNDALDITSDSMGSLTFNRVDEIIPTPIPTPGL
jgi:hypothetical protein